MIRKLKRIFLVASIFFIVVVCITAVINLYIYQTVKGDIVSYHEDLTNEAKYKLKDFKADGALILGAGVYEDGTPTPMLKDRLDLGIYLYKNGYVSRLLLSGDNGTIYYNEVIVMLNYVKEAGIPTEDIFCDYAGFSTYDSMYRAKSIFKMNKIMVVSQTYHLYRALYIGRELGVKCIGVGSDQKKYVGQLYRDGREVLARVKDFGKAKIGCKSVLGGNEIPINGNSST